MNRVQFCGAIGGSVTVRQGETAQEAIERAERLLLEIMGRHAKRLSDDGQGPNIGLEIDDTIAHRTEGGTK